MDMKLTRRSFALGMLAMGAFAANALADQAGQGQGGQGQGGQGHQGGQGQGNAELSTFEPQEVAYDADGNRIVVDAGGAQVTVPADLTTIMTFGSCGVINTLVETLGCGWMIANNMSPRFANGGWEYQYKFAPQMADAPQYENASGEIDFEGVVAAAPQLCVVMQSATAENLREKGLNALYVDFGNGRDSSAIKNAMTLLGQALYADDKAAEYNEYLDGMVEKIDGVVAAVPEEERLKVLYGNITSYTNPHILSEWFIPAAGGISVTADIHEKGAATFTAEDVLAWNPDAFIMIQDQTEEIMADEQLAGVAAVQNGFMFTLPTVGHFITGSTEIAYGILYIANKLYGDLYPVDDLRQDIYYFYDTFFGYQMTDEEIDAIVNH